MNEKQTPQTPDIVDYAVNTMGMEPGRAAQDRADLDAFRNELPGRDLDGTDRLAYDRGSISFKEKGRRRIGVIGASVVFGAGSLLGLNALDNQAESHQAHTEQVALDAMNNGEQDHTAMNAVVVLHPGVKYRSEPHMSNVDPDAGSDGTVAGEVGSGQVLRLDRPRQYTDDQGNEWLSFQMTEGKGGPYADADNQETTYWVNYSALREQERNGAELVTVYDYPENSDPALGNNFTIHLQVEEQTGLVVPAKGGPGEYSPVAIGSMQSVEDFQNGINQAGLVQRGETSEKPLVVSRP